VNTFISLGEIDVRYDSDTKYLFSVDRDASRYCHHYFSDRSEDAVQQNQQSLDLENGAIEDQVDGGAVHTREKRTLFLKKKLVAGLLGFGLGVAKG